MSKNKHRRTFKFKLKLYPSSPIVDINYHSIDLNLHSGFEDWLYFHDHPEENKFLRQARAGEFSNPAIRFVLVRRGLSRVPLTIEQTKRLEDPDFFRRVSGE